MPLGISDNLFQRIVSALALLPPVLWVIYAGGWWFSSLLLLGGGLMILEWCALTNVKGVVARLAASVAILGLVVHIQMTEGSHIDWILPGLLIVAVAATSAIKIWGDRLPAWWLGGIAYVGLPIVALWSIRDASAMTVFWVFLVVWATDIGGYFAGKGIGGPKLAPRISPKKTWAGLFGGMALSMLVTAVLHFGFGFAQNAVGIIVLSGVMAVWSQIGDLLESGVKRHFGVKDSGGLIPGHGGLLDRVDGLVFAAPGMVLTLMVTETFGWVL